MKEVYKPNTSYMEIKNNQIKCTQYRRKNKIKLDISGNQRDQEKRIESVWLDLFKSFLMWNNKKLYLTSSQ